MISQLVTPEQLAETFQISVDQLHQLRRRNNWPCVRLGRFVYRFTEDQVDEIVSKHTERPEKSPPSSTGTIPGQTARSAAHHRRS